MYGLGNQMQALLVQMHTFASTGKGLAWHPISSGPAPNIWIAGWATLTVMLCAVAGSIYFFYQCRRLNRKAELPAPQAAAVT